MRSQPTRASVVNLIQHARWHMPCYSEALADYIVAASFDALPPPVVRQAKFCLLDAIGVGLASTDKPWARAVLSVVRAHGGRPNATVWGFGDKTSEIDAALANALFVHSMDFNDDLAGVQVGGIIPPTAVAVGEAVGATGAELLTAMVIGYDIATRSAVALDSQELYLRGLQPTAICGAFAAAAIAGKLLKLTPPQMANAFGIAASYSGGTIEFLKEGTDTKRFHVAKAAAGGILSAELAQAGMTGPRAVFEGEFGVLRAYSGGNANPPALVEELGTRYDILDTSFKLYPFCDGNAAPLEAALAIVREQRLSVDDISGMHFRIKSFLIPYSISYFGDTDRKYRPKNELDAQMSLPYCVAVGLLNNGSVSLADFTPARFGDPQICKLADRITGEGDAELDKIPLRPMSMPTICTLKTTDGRVFEKRLDYQTGDPRNPFSPRDFSVKFLRCASAMLPRKCASELERRILAIDEMPNVRELSALLAGLVGAKEHTG